MPDIDRIIEQIVAASRAKGGRTFASSRVYADEPILMRGSQMASYRPEPIRQMRELARRPESRSWSDARLFVEQARLMEGYEDDFPYQGTFKSYYPTYEAMDDRQLRGYFTWRARVRRGEVEQTSTSFAYVYLYELINGVGAEPGERPWLVDYVVYHDLDPRLAEPYAGAGHDRAVATLARAERGVLERAGTSRRRAARDFGAHAATDRELFSALDELSTYRPSASRLYRDEPEALVAVTCAVFERLARYYHSSRSQGLTVSLFGSPHPMPHLMFASAVFCPPGPHPDCVVQLGETRRYECRRNLWTCDALHDGGGRSARLGQALRAADRQLRAALDYPHPLKEHGDPKYLTQLVEREVRDYLDWRAAHAPRRVEIDLSKLAGIRAAAAVTREALLVDEEREEAPATPEPESAGPASAVSPGEKGAPLGLTPEELAFLEALLEGRRPGGNADMLADAVNEKLIDLIGDTAVEFDEAGEPTIVEDYVEDVRAALSA